MKDQTATGRYSKMPTVGTTATTEKTPGIWARPAARRSWPVVPLPLNSPVPIAVVRKLQIAQPAKPPTTPPIAADNGSPTKFADANIIVRQAAETAADTPTTMAAWTSAAPDWSDLTSSYTLLSSFTARSKRGANALQVEAARTAGRSTWSGVATVGASCECGSGAPFV